MSRFLEAFVTSVVRRPRVWAAIALGIMLGGALLGLRTELADDARSLVADADPAVHAQLLALSQFTAVDNLLVVIDGAGHEAELVPAAQALVTTLLEPPATFSSARFEVVAAERLLLLEALLPRRFALDPRDPQALFTEGALAARLTELRARLLAPQALVDKGLAVRDPMGSIGQALAGVSNAPGLPRLDVSSGRFFSSDGSCLLMVAQPVGNPFAGSDAARSMERVAAAATAVQKVAPHVVLRTLGAHRFTHDAEGLIRHDVHFGVVTSLVAVLLIFLLFFRRLRLIAVALPPLLFGSCIAAGVAGLLHAPAHGIVLAFAGSCLGLAIDYTIYLMATVAQVGGGARTALPVAARKLGSSMHLLVGTTVIGLSTLCFSRVVALQQMGLIAVGAVGGAFIGALIWVPIILPLVAPAGEMPPLRSGPWTVAVRFSLAHPRPVVVGAIVLASVFAWLSLGTRIDGDLTHLDTHRPEAIADENRLVQAFGDPGRSALALVEARDLDTALSMAEQVASRLRELGIAEVQTPSSFAPSLGTVTMRQQRWCADRDIRLSRFRASALAAGFRADAFAAFEADWQTWCGATSESHAEAEVAVFERLVGRPMVRSGDDGGVRLAVGFDATPEQLAAAKPLFATLSGVTLVHRQALNERLVEVVATEMPRLGLWSFLLITLVLVLGLRDWAHPARALAPAVLAMLAFFGVMAAAGVPINLMSLCVLPLLNGSGTDYGILMTYADTDTDDKALTTRAFGLTAAALTTLAGFGPMACADYYALATIGRSVLLAIGSAALFSLFLPPALSVVGRKRD